MILRLTSRFQSGQASNGLRGAANPTAARLGRFVPIVFGLLLLAAAVFKGHELATGPVPERSLWTSRWFQISVVLFELALAIWLIIGAYPRLTRWVALACFLGFFDINLYQALTGVTSCGCFGTLRLNPWQAAALDLVALTSFFAWRPCVPTTVLKLSLPSRLIRAGILFVLLAIPGVLTMMNYSVSGIAPYLRQDPRLSSTLALQDDNPTMPTILFLLHEATDLTFTADLRLEKDWAQDRPKLGSMELPRVRAWALMELIAQRQS
jgi:hypothetical protein